MVVTGAGRGIGRAVAVALAARGHDVALLGRTEADLDLTAERVTAEGRRALVVRCDVARAKDVESAASRVTGGLGVPVAVVNNAGVVRRARVDRMTDEDWDEVLDVNLKGTFLVTRAFLPAMLLAKCGRFVAMGSISGTLGTPLLSAYCAAKWGVIGFTKSLAEELRGTGANRLGALESRRLPRRGLLRCCRS